MKRCYVQLSLLNEEIGRLSSCLATPEHVGAAHHPMASRRYRTAIITFFDILGFREIVASKTAVDIASILTDIARFSDAEKPLGPRESDLHVTAFSDSIIRARRIDSAANKRHPIGLLYYELSDLLYAQVNLLTRGVLLRGGLVVDEIHATRQMIFGPGLVAAYELEAGFARFPRIAIASSVLRALETNPLLRAAHHDVATEQSYIRKLVRQGDDGVWFLDYLWASEHEADDPIDYPSFLIIHRNLIISGMTAEKRLTSTAQKYVWLARYHNHRIVNLTDKWLNHFGLERRDLLVPLRDFDYIYAFPKSRSV